METKDIPTYSEEEFQGKTRLYRVETYRSGTNRSGFLGVPEYERLVEIIRDSYLNTYPTRDRDISIRRVERSLSHPRTILELALYEGIPIGYGIFPRLRIETNDPEPESVLYSSRAFQEEHEGEGLGTHFLSEAIRLHQEERVQLHKPLLKWGALMTQNAYSIRSLIKLQRLGIIGKIRPFDEIFERDPKSQSLLLGVHQQAFVGSLGIDTITGVSRGELRELGMNEAYKPSREDVGAWEIHQKMVLHPPHGLGMNRDAGDVVYVLYDIPRPGNGSVATMVP